MGGNELTSIPTSALSTLDMLKKLEMQENRIQSIKEGDFEGKLMIDFDWSLSHPYIGWNKKADVIYVYLTLFI